VIEDDEGDEDDGDDDGTDRAHRVDLVGLTSPSVPIPSAINSLHGRFFAKRQVEAIFFDEERWEHGDLASHPDEY
jgi:hypothetical protein